MFHQGQAKGRSQLELSQDLGLPLLSMMSHASRTQFAALGSHFYGPGLEFSFRRLWERLSLSTDLGAIITVLTGEDLWFSLGHIKSRGRPWQ